MQQHTPQEQPQATATGRRSLTLGIPAPVHDRRLPLTPEGVSIITGYGMEVWVQHGAGTCVNYDDGRYAAAGARMSDRAAALDCDFVVSVEPLAAEDAGRIRRGAALFTLDAAVTGAAALDALLKRRVSALALRNIRDGHGRRPFDDAVSEISGRAAVTMAVARLAEVDAGAAAGKGILVGGVAGVIPCEVVIIGSGIAARAAAASALGLGATVRLFDDDTYGLRKAMEMLGGRLICSSLQPHVLRNAVASADVIVATPMSLSYEISAATIATAKRGVLAYDLTDNGTGTLAGFEPVDMACAALRASEGGRRCYCNLSASVPRTTAMALSNGVTALIPLLVGRHGANDVAGLEAGVQGAAYTYKGYVTDAALAREMSVRYVDIAIFGRLS